MKLRIVAAVILGLTVLFGSAAPALAQDPPLGTNCQRYDFLNAPHHLKVSTGILEIAKELCDDQPNGDAPALRRFGDTYKPRVSKSCEHKDQYPDCIADWIEGVQYFENRSNECFAQFKQNNAAGKHEVTCPEIAKTTPPAAQAAPPTEDDNLNLHGIGGGFAIMGAIACAVCLICLNRGESPWRPS